MIDALLQKKGIPSSARITYKALMSVATVALAVITPQLVHSLFGNTGGIKWLPMYYPVLIGGCILGSKYGSVIGFISPIVSYIITTQVGNAMPSATRLPYMMVELTVFATVSGCFTKKITKSALWAFPAVIMSQIIGRCAFAGMAAILQKYVPLSLNTVLGQIKVGLPGQILQLVLAPIIIILVRKQLIKEEK